MGGVVAVECLVAYFVFPSPDEVAALAEKNIQKTLPVNLVEHSEAEASHESDMVEVELGEYRITVTQPNGAASLCVEFHLVRYRSRSGIRAHQAPDRTQHQPISRPSIDRNPQFRAPVTWRTPGWP